MRNMAVLHSQENNSDEDSRDEACLEQGTSKACRQHGSQMPQEEVLLSRRRPPSLITRRPHIMCLRLLGQHVRETRVSLAYGVPGGITTSGLVS